MTEWKEYTGSDEQIAEIMKCTGFIVDSQYSAFKAVSTFRSVHESDREWLKDHFSKYDVKQYLICNPHPLADMICQQARTGQPVWVRYTLEWDRRSDTIETDCTTTPDWNIPGAEYSFTPFDD